MFSDTHFHFQNFTEKGINGGEVLKTLSDRDCFFALDIGTQSNDLISRKNCVDECISKISEVETQNKIKSFFYYAAGIWPWPNEIENKENAVETLKSFINDKNAPKIVAIGECGLDHHWNPSGPDARSENDFSEKMLSDEKTLFEMQLKLAKSLSLPVIVHSRDAFSDTLDCIKKIGYHKGIIHCFSYGKDEAKAFLDLGWSISFSGSITYAKKSKLNEMFDLIKSIPDDKILCETDSPYLAPHPFRGKTNTPIFVEEVYKFAATARGTTPEKLSETVDNNIRTLFNLTK